MGKMLFRNTLLLWLTLLVQYALGQNSQELSVGLLVERFQDIAKYQAIAEDFLSKNHKTGSISVIVQSVEGPWGQTSNHVVDLIYENKTAIIIGILGGQNAHLVEQVTAKSQIPYIELNATDPSLSKAYLPYFFRLTYSSDQLAKAIAGKVTNDFSRVYYLGDSTYDSKMAEVSLRQEFNQTLEVLSDLSIKEHQLAQNGLVICWNDETYSSLRAQLGDITNQVIILNSTGNEIGTNVNKVTWCENNTKDCDPLTVKLEEAISLVLQITENESNITPIKLGRALHRQRSDSGPLGTFSFDKNGNLLRELSFQ